MASAVGAGYMLGRTKKMKLALMLAAGGASRQLSSGGSLGLLNEGRKLLADSPEVAKLGKTVRHKGEGVRPQGQITGGGSGKGKGKKLKLTNIVESIDVGVPVQLAYNARSAS